MHPRATNLSTRTLDVRRFGFDPAGALGSDNEYSGLAANRLPILASQDPGMHAPFGNVLGAEVTCEAFDRTIIHGLDRDRLVGPERRFLFAGRRLAPTRVWRAGAFPRGNHVVGQGVIPPFRWADCRLPGNRQRTAGACLEAARVHRAVSGESSHAGQV